MYLINAGDMGHIKPTIFRYLALKFREGCRVRKIPTCYEVFRLILSPRIRWTDVNKMYIFLKGIRVFVLD